MTIIRTSLTRWQSEPVMDEVELRRAAAAAYHQKGIVMVKLDEVSNDWERQFLRNIGDRMYGRRRAKG